MKHNGSTNGASLEQCPSSKKEGKPVNVPRSAREVSRATGKALWRSLDDLTGTPEFRDFLEREFPKYASELLDGSRRHFLKIMGASLALAGVGSLAGCRRPDHRILAFNEAPEHSIPGKPLFYATAMPLPGGGSEGLLAETYEGRPTKLEGNPLHPSNQGKSDIRSQSTVLDLYDPDRDMDLDSRVDASDLESFLRSEMAGRTSGVAFLVEKSTSPSRDRLRDEIVARFGEGSWLPYEAVEDANAIEGSRVAFGSAYRTRFDLAEARVIATFDHDFLSGEGSSLSNNRGYAAGRYVEGTRPGHRASDSRMSRLYAVESMMTPSGGQADHRFAAKPSRIGAVLVMVARSVMRQLDNSTMSGVASAIDSVYASLSGDDMPDQAWIDALASDLVANRGTGVVMVGPSQPAAVHALAHSLNSALNNVGRTVIYDPMQGDTGANSLASLRTLIAGLDSGAIDTVVTIGVNPVYDAPADLEFAAAYAKATNRIHLGDPNETAAAATMYVLRSHYLERWGDVVDWDGAYSVVQPQIEALYNGPVDSKGSMDELTMLATLLGEQETDPYDIIRATLQRSTRLDEIAFEKVWRRTLHDGVQQGSQARASAPRVDATAVASALSSNASSMAPSDGVEAVFQACPKVFDGRFANNGWLQELPHAVTKVAWGNPVLVSMDTAERLGLKSGRHSVSSQYNHAHIAVLTIDGRAMNVPVWIQPGLADDTAVVTLGYGRTTCGRVGEGVGFNAYAGRTSGAMRIASGVTLERARGERPELMACTQDHWTMEGRDIFREVDLVAWQKHGDEDISEDTSIQKDPYYNKRGINFAERLGTLGHTPANKDIYLPEQKREQSLLFVKLDENGDPELDGRGRLVGIENEYGRRIQQWGMSIDLTTCSGCGACTIACQAENNIPIVGKKEVAKGREMHWIRVDRYYASPVDADGERPKDKGATGPTAGDIDMLVQPITCVQCENAPCEVVCPVNATVHSPEGMNDMAYNRCIGTRYCSNNCPYKVRRFNYFDYATKQFQGQNALSDTILEPSNENWVPPRLRQKTLEVATMQNNPHVTVRSRGVMEKCTYCVQRINAARVETKLEDLDVIPDGFVQTACQQACPTDSIVFGDIYDNGANDGAGSLVQQKRNDPRSFSLLGYLNTRPRTTFMLRLRNPNPAIRTPNDEPFHHGGHGDDHGGDHHDGESHGEEAHSMAPADPDRIMSLPVLAGGGELA